LLSDSQVSSAAAFCKQNNEVNIKKELAQKTQGKQICINNNNNYKQDKQSVNMQ